MVCISQDNTNDKFNGLYGLMIKCTFKCIVYWFRPTNTPSCYSLEQHNTCSWLHVIIFSRYETKNYFAHPLIHLSNSPFRVYNLLVTNANTLKQDLYSSPFSFGR